MDFYHRLFLQQYIWWYLCKAKERIRGCTVEGIIGVGTGAGGSLNASIGFDESGNTVFFKIGASGGAAIGSGWFVGQSHTLIVNP